MVQPKDERNAQMLIEHVGGDSYAEVGRNHGISPQAARVVIVREARAAIDRLELRLMSNLRDDSVELFLIPGLSGPDFDLAVDWLQFCLRELAARGVATKVHYRPTTEGVAFGIEQDPNPKE